MRYVLICLGLLAVLAYAVHGAYLMNDAGLVAASGQPLGVTVTALEASGEGYSPQAGVLFALFGAVLGTAWAVLSLVLRPRWSGWRVFTIWAGVLAAGAAGYFVLSFGPFMSLGDTFPEWDAEAARGLEVPLYAASALAAVGAVVGLLGMRREATQRAKEQRANAEIRVPNVGF